jgi:hypothetical protein
LEHPVLLDGYLYAFSGRDEPDASFRCVEFKTGKLQWSRDEKWQEASAARFRSFRFTVAARRSSPTANSSRSAKAGRLGMFKPDPNRPEEICSFQVPQMGYPCWTAPVLSRQRLYLRSEDRLVCRTSKVEIVKRKT